MTKSAQLRASLPVVALVGRTNVGKSTLFNLLAREQKAVVAGVPHVTRDRMFATVGQGEKEFLLVDTGGMGEESGDPLRDLQARRISLPPRGHPLP